MSTTEPTAVKPGSKTSEHRITWLTILGVVGGIAGYIATAPISLPASIVIAAGAVAAGAASGAYAISRGMAKRGK